MKNEHKVLCSFCKKNEAVIFKYTFGAIPYALCDEHRNKSMSAELNGSAVLLEFCDGSGNEQSFPISEYPKRKP